MSRRLPEHLADGGIHVGQKRGELVSETVGHLAGHDGDGLQKRRGGAARVK
jgi:hypothetical protein